MSEADIGRRGSGAADGQNGNATAIAAADFLYLAAAPTFAIMALLTAAPGGGSPDAVCSVAGASALGDLQPAKRRLARKGTTVTVILRLKAPFTP